MLCGGGCCTLVNSVIDALVEEGDLDPNAEVCCMLCNILFIWLIVVSPYELLSKHNPNQG